MPPAPRQLRPLPELRPCAEPGMPSRAGASWLLVPGLRCSRANLPVCRSSRRGGRVKPPLPPGWGRWPRAGSVRGWQGGSRAEGREPLALRQQGHRVQHPKGDRELREPRIALASPWAAGPQPGTAKYGPTPGPGALLYPEGFAILPGAGARLWVGASMVPPLPQPRMSRLGTASSRGPAGAVQPCPVLGSPLLTGWLGVPGPPHLGGCLSQSRGDFTSGACLTSAGPEARVMGRAPRGWGVPQSWGMAGEARLGHQLRLRWASSRAVPRL